MDSEDYFITYVVCLIILLAIFLYATSRPSKENKTDNINDKFYEEEDDEDYVYVSKNTYTTEPNKERCSFCGSEEHTVGNCSLFIISIMG